MFDINLARQFLRKKLISSDGHLVKRVRRMPPEVQSIEPPDERSQEVALFEQLKEELIQPTRPAEFHQPRRLVISLEL